MKARAGYAHRIAKEYGGILPYHEIFYIRSILFSAGHALAAFARYRESIVPHGKVAGAQKVIFTLQEAIGHCAAVSRYFWPASDDRLAVARGKNLCAAFDIDEHDSLFGVRAIRNAVEHFDERLDRFCSRDLVGTIFDLVVESSDLANADVTHVLRLADPASETIVLFGRKFFFAGLEGSVQKIHDRAAAMDQNGGRL